MSEDSNQGLSLLSSSSVQAVLFVAIIVGSFFLGSLWTRVQILEKGGVTTGVAATAPSGGQSGQAAAPAVVQEGQIRDTFNKSLVKFGEANKKLVFIEVADPSCPYCQIAAGLNPELNKQVGDRFKLVQDGGAYVAPVIEMKKLVESGKASFAWLYSPGHGNGEMGTKAMYCAFEKGKFWNVHDKLMTKEGYDLLNNIVKNDKTRTTELVDFLKTAMSANDLKNCLESGKYDNRLPTDISLASGIGISGTPGFYINSQQFTGAVSWKDMEAAVKASL